MEMIRTRFLASAWLLLCLTLGGSTTGGILANSFLQIAAGALVLYLVHSRIALDPASRSLLLLLLAAAALLLLALVPLPPAVWQGLAGRRDIAAAYTLAAIPLPWLPFSLTPDATLATSFSLLPPLAMVLLVLASSAEGRRNAIVTLTAFSFASVLFGVFQQVSGYSSDTYIYQYTSRGGAVGFFANRNHLATLCLMTIPFLAAFVTVVQRSRDGSRPGEWIPAASALALMVVGTIVVQSLAGWLLLLPTLLACLLLLRRLPQKSARILVTATVAVLVATVLTALFAPWSDIVPVAAEVHPQERRAIMGRTWEAATTFFPFGTGPGSFVSVFPRFEDLTGGSTAYINHAHNDYLEWLLEAGIPGILLLGAFLMWWGNRIGSVWQSGGDPFARAATIGIGVVLAHSFVDYPVRTAAIACVFALCCGVASAPAAVVTGSRRTRQSSGGSTRTIMLGPRNGPEAFPTVRPGKVT